MSNCTCATLLIAHDSIPELKGAILDDFTYETWASPSNTSIRVALALSTE
jgi:hypothetical protein